MSFQVKYHLGPYANGWRHHRGKALLKEVDRRSIGGEEELLGLSGTKGVLRKSDIAQRSAQAESHIGYKMVALGQLICNKMQAWNGVFGISPFDGITSPDYAIYEFHGDCDPRLIEYMVKTDLFAADFQSRSNGIGTGFMRLNPSEFLRTNFWLPNREDQDRIVRFLDRETTRIDTLIEKKSRFIELLKEKRAAVITHAVTKGLDPDVPMKESGFPWFGLIPAHWQISPAKHLLSRSLQYGATESGDTFREDWPRYIRITDITSEGRLRDEGAKSIDPCLARPYLVKNGDILLARSGATVGKSFFYEGVDDAACFAGYMIRASANKRKLLPRYLNFFLQSNPYWEFILGTQSQSTIPNVSAEKYASLPVTLPTTTEQASICDWLQKETSKIDTLISITERSIELLKEKRSALITAAVTGKIDVREAA